MVQQNNKRKKKKKMFQNKYYVKNSLSVNQIHFYPGRILDPDPHQLKWILSYAWNFFLFKDWERDKIESTVYRLPLRNLKLNFSDPPCKDDIARLQSNL